PRKMPTENWPLAAGSHANSAACASCSEYGPAGRGPHKAAADSRLVASTSMAASLIARARTCMPLPISRSSCTLSSNSRWRQQLESLCCDVTLAWAAACAFLSDDLSSFEDLATPHAPRFSASDGSG